MCRARGQCGLNLALVAACVALAGCNQDAATEALIAENRGRLLLSDEPGNAVTVLDLRESYQGPCEVTLVGRVGGVPEPWSKGKAEFVLADPSILVKTEGHDHECGDNCPFCKKKQEEQLSGLALIAFADAKGKPLAIDARKLFDLSQEQTLVIRGTAQLDQTGSLVVAANGLYIRR